MAAVRDRAGIEGHVGSLPRCDRAEYEHLGRIGRRRRAVEPRNVDTGVNDDDSRAERPSPIEVAGDRVRQRDDQICTRRGRPHGPGHDRAREQIVVLKDHRTRQPRPEQARHRRAHAPGDDQLWAEVIDQPADLDAVAREPQRRTEPVASQPQRAPGEREHRQVAISHRLAQLSGGAGDPERGPRASRRTPAAAARLRRTLPSR